MYTSDNEFNKWLAKVEAEINHDLYHFQGILYKWFEDFGLTVDEAVHKIKHEKSPICSVIRSSLQTSVIFNF